MLNIVGIGTYESRYKGSASGKKAGCNSVAVSASGIIMKFLLCIRLIVPLDRYLEVLFMNGLSSMHRHSIRKWNRKKDDLTHCC